MTLNPLANIEVRGGIISAEFMENLREEKLKNPGVQFRTFRTFDGTELKNAKQLDNLIREAFDSLVERWDSLDYLYGEMDVSRARERWILHVFKALGFDPLYNQKALTLDKKKKLKFFISHRGWSSRTAPPLHTVPLVDLEQPYKVSGHKRSPHDELQRFLNASLAHKWGIVTNGIQLRVLRDFHHTSTKGYVEFDLQNILRERSFTDFRALFRIAHASRFLPGDDGEVILEQFYKESVAAGVKVGQNLRENVIKALEALGNGFIYFDDDLREKLQEDNQACKDYYSEVLRVIYRMLFLLYAEQRGMLPLKGLYIEEYSMVKLRGQAEHHSGKDESTDLWEGLKATFKMIKEGCPALGVFGYNGSLFDDDEITTIVNLNIRNEDIITAVKNLTLVQEENTTKRINYLDLGVEEIGSIYESLLDYVPRVSSNKEVLSTREIPSRTFFLDPRGTERRSSASYYTSPILIDKLIQSALVPVLESKLHNSSDKEKDLLAIKICDPACGSGAFLISATNYLGYKLSQIRTRQDEPSFIDIQHSKRDVLSHCIYGVDLNPMAVELVKVSLWIDCAELGKPLNFLDHHIKCGDSLIGTNSQLIREGIPIAAYKPLQGDDKNICKLYKNENLRYTKRLHPGQLGMNSFIENTAQFHYQLANQSEIVNTDVEYKKQQYYELRQSNAWKINKFIANMWCSLFFWRFDNDTVIPPSQIILTKLIDNPGYLSEINNIVSIVNDIAEDQHFFHWHIEFPEVFNRGECGFDCILGNPPFLGGLKIGSTFGDKYRNFLDTMYKPFSGRPDYSSAFFRRGFELLKDNGLLGMIATNTIGQGDTRESGLAVVVSQGGTITYANRFIKWPGSATVEVNLISLIKGKWDGQILLDNQPVETISSWLEDGIEAEPRSIKQNRKQAFQGDVLRGIGFVINNDEYNEILEENPNNKECIFPYLNGEILNNEFDFKSDRYAICFHDWPLNKANEYSQALQIVKERVKPERDKVKQKKDKVHWWRYNSYRHEMRKKINSMDNVLVKAFTSERHMIALVPNEYIFSHAICVFAFDDDYHFSLLQSNIHEIWLRFTASTMRTDIRYTISDCYDTFPFPQIANKVDKEIASKLGKEYQLIRKTTMETRKIGMTKTYNLINNETCIDEDIIELRKKHASIDNAILNCYGWGDINLNHNFYKNKRGNVRYAVSSKARSEVLNRLFKLNLEISSYSNINSVGNQLNLFSFSKGE